jgi:hypothetical protein
VGEGGRPRPVEEGLGLKGNVDQDDRDDDKYHGAAGDRRDDERAEAQ